MSAFQNSLVRWLRRSAIPPLRETIATFGNGKALVAIVERQHDMSFGSFTTHTSAGGTGTWWPHGKGFVEHDDLQQLLEAVAQRAARGALASFGSADPMTQLDSAISVGTAVELLAKAVLCSIDPALLIERGDASSSLPLVGAGHPLAADPFHLDVKTLGARAALTLISKTDGAPRLDVPKLVLACETRNAATHLGLVQEHALLESVRALVAFVDDVAELLSITAAEFWGDDLAAAVVDVRAAAATASRELVDSLRDQARAEMHRLVGSLDQAMRTVVLEHLSGSSKPDVERDEEAVPWRCPVCEQQGWLVCDVERGALTGERVNWHDYDVYVERTGYPFWFECPVCKFETDQVDLAELDLPSTLELERDYEPREQAEP